MALVIHLPGENNGKSMSEETEIERCVNEVLLGGLEDLIMASEIASVVVESTGRSAADKSVMQRSLDVMRKLLEERLAEVGDAVLVAIRGKERVAFIPWALSVDESLKRIAREWYRFPNGPSLGDICWFRLTDRGRRRAGSAIPQ